ncbi:MULTISPECIES: hypothetical protein [Saccharothrix]|uniref:hypothetical protein n=1 Tax=Saccharothrix TaxID=2071 RepID=UPI00093A1E08|nr:hypothetical protein [Saccharothrix sp. CB00851]OKI28600.1 hypothetical protein A6A25_30785 [Saccharothrix sp. CB00851]
MEFVSPQHKELVVADRGVRFADGEAEVTDKTVIEALRGLPAELGVSGAGRRPPKDSDAAVRRTHD